MLAGQPSRTALGAAGHRAAHQVLEGGRIFKDPLALRILGQDAEAAIERARQDPSQRRLRLFIAVRSRFAEDALAVAVEGGVRQVVLLGAGLDTYAYRTPLEHRLRVFEVDHPTTQTWKRERLRDAEISVPPRLTYAPIDFESETIAEGLARVAFDFAAPSFFTWLGVVPYLTESAIFSTLSFIGGLSRAHVVFDYGNPAQPGEEPVADGRNTLAARVGAVGEPLQTRFETADLRARLEAHGFRHIDDLSPNAIRERYFGGRGTASSDRGGHVVHAATVAP